MGQTPDRHPGESDDEGLILENRPPGEQPVVSGGVRYVDGSFALRDSLGVFNPRSGGGISAAEHEALDQLVHDVTETSWEEFLYTSGQVNTAIVWTSSAKTTKIREDQYTYGSGGRVSQAITIQYGPTGLEVERITEQYTYSPGGRVASVNRVRTP